MLARSTALLSCLALGAGCFSDSSNSDGTSGGDSDGTSDGTTTEDSVTAGSATTTDSASASGTGGSTTAGSTTTVGTTGDATATAGTTDATTTATSGGSTTGDTGGSSTGAQPFCGDGVVGDDEVCDDGVNAGAADGDCNPDCSKEVVTKLIVLSPDVAAGDLAPGQNPIPVVDALCPNGYKAFFVDNQNRIATVTPYLGNGQVDWVIDSWTRYANADNETIWVTTDLRLLGVGDDNQWKDLVNTIGVGTGFVFTGLRYDYTTSAADCDGWSQGLGTGFSFTAGMGQADILTNTAIGSDGDTGGICSVTRPVFCVEQ
jgi:cysteine-rich repeat protein